ncbi:tRNA lysidine(34) synthetase TilS [Shewanella mangrovi]|uniref:tRNA lysidine(34) synthetase TilS n=1 Tax=Shewanella mangrovi TaxID=1515746 RepID=UPI00068DA588|nr:tRNA lysidine(34) synthetase TilS [Shewanella mangrovi]
MSRALTDRIIAEMQRLIASLPQPPQHIWLGFSGGMDSALLAYALSLFVRQAPEWRSQVHLVHVHHGLNRQADTWAQHCMASARVYQLDGRVLAVDVDTSAGMSIEAEARKQRYQALASLMQANDILLTAHHQDDQLETVLLALKRGQGPKGLAAMGAVQPFSSRCWQLRPMLNVSRSEIEQAVQALALDYVDDDSNLDTRYDRNFLRQDIIPMLKQRWPAFAETASRSATLCAEQQQLLDEIALEKIAPILSACEFTGQPILPLAPLTAFSDAWQRQLVRTFIAQQCIAPPSQIQLQQLLQQLFSAADDASVMLTFGGYQYRRFNDALYIVPPLPPAAATIVLSDAQSAALRAGQLRLAMPAPWQALASVVVQQGPRLNPALLQGQVEICFSLLGSTRCHPHWRQQGRELKKIWQETKVPTWLRNRMPMLLVNGKLVAIANLFINQHALATSEQAGISLDLH